MEGGGEDFRDEMPGWRCFTRAAPGHPASNILKLNVKVTLFDEQKTIQIQCALKFSKLGSCIITHIRVV